MRDNQPDLSWYFPVRLPVGIPSLLLSFLLAYLPFSFSHFLSPRYNANHLDLNRNFPDFFHHNTARIQAETRAVMNWIQDTRFVLSANLHGGTLVANYPFDSYEGSACMRQVKLQAPVYDIVLQPLPYLVTP